MNDTEDDYSIFGGRASPSDFEQDLLLDLPSDLNFTPQFRNCLVASELYLAILMERVTVAQNRAHLKTLETTKGIVLISNIFESRLSRKLIVEASLELSAQPISAAWSADSEKLAVITASSFNVSF